MKLHSVTYGDPSKPVLVALHGLLGSSRNWQAAAQELADAFCVSCLDLRNHGFSPWAEAHSFEEMAGDVAGWIESHGRGRVSLLGHSMGGKVAMQLACRRPNLIHKLIVVDIVPKAYPKTHDDEFLAMRSFDPASLATRSDAERHLEHYVSDWALRKFLLTNLVRRDSGSGFRWQINLDAIERSLREIEQAPIGPNERYEGEALFIMGGKSRYFASGDEELIRRHFPASAIEVLRDCGHNPHFECRERFAEVVRDFAP